MTKTIALFGATGKTGRLFLQKALYAGYRVKALVRDNNKLSVQDQNLTVIQGNVLDPADVNRTVEGTDLVVSLFGHVKGAANWLQTDGTKHIVAAMHKYQVPRVISLSGGALPFPEKDKPKLADHLIGGIMRLFASKMVNDAIAHHEVLANSGLSWVIVRGPRLTLQPEKGAYRVGWVGVNASTQIGRADLAQFILKLVEDESFDGTMPFVSY